MEPIQSAMKRWMNSNKKIEQTYQAISEEVLNDPKIQAILSEHIELDEKDINRNLMKLYEYHQASKDCENCPNLAGCVNILKGYTPHVELEGKEISLRYERCSNKVQDDLRKEKESLVQSLYMPKQIRMAELTELKTDTYERKALVTEVIDFVKNYSRENFHKGLYIHGPFGTGKSYILGVIANELKKRNVRAAMIYMPEFVRVMKSSIQDDSLQSKMDHFKNVDVLMFDDIGAETISPWFRDEVLGAILQYRMTEELPVFFTSNFNLDQLEKHLATSNRGDVETIKAGRIVERIKQLSKPIELEERYRTN
ncbi:primosomal protein DnaI [Gracilibacillus ureilyticus]|uniref:Primosomal protein DnaI n=1 Tax=Gracilibacillus ureilyticus TaxID=531814 RepID=A0A1H9UF77_9BACI|nr:primosomal protein DnaI [Gracilibacillus ureilyticus]SES07921.1 primosomal protein DnaI [Gracilibacillus ureilyticus]